MNIVSAIALLAHQPNMSGTLDDSKPYAPEAQENVSVSGLKGQIE